MKRLLRLLRFAPLVPSGRCFHCGQLRRYADMTEIGRDEWVCWWCR